MITDRIESFTESFNDRLMRLIVTADLHYNHPRSRPLAEELIDEINRVGGDLLLLVGDTAITADDFLEQCLSRFRFAGPKLFVAGNHELWTTDGDSYAIFTRDLPRRLQALGWQWLETQPFIADEIAIVGTVGWYDYSFAQADLQIPRRFYEAKVSPGAAAHFPQFENLFARGDDIPESAMQIVARWNDGKFVHLGRSDEQFLGEILAHLESQLASLAHAKTIVAATHHLPFRELLPPPHSAQWDFAKAYLGSEKLGELLLKFPNVKHAFCGHSHFAMQATIGHIEAINIGSGYRAKTYKILELADG
jgi:3',5'-cyclic AMP phosphodiesterase CpdA